MSAVLNPVPASPATETWDRFRDQRAVPMTTYRRDGTPVGTPVDIAVDGEVANGGLSVFAFLVRDGRITAIDVVANPEKLRHVPEPPSEP